MLVHEAAVRLGCTPDNVRVLERTGKLRAARIGHVRVFRQADVERLALQRAEKRRAVPEDAGPGAPR